MASTAIYVLCDPDWLGRASIPESGSGKWSVWEAVGDRGRPWGLWECIAVQIETAVHPTLQQLCSAFAAACRVEKSSRMQILEAEGFLTSSSEASCLYFARRWKGSLVVTRRAPRLMERTKRPSFLWAMPGRPTSDAARVM